MGTEDNILTKNNQLLRETTEDLLQKYAFKYIIISTTTVVSLKSASLISAGESVEVMQNPRALVHAET